MIRGVGDPVGRLLFGALGRAVAGEQGFEDLRPLRHLLDRPLGATDRRGFCDFGRSRSSGNSWVHEEKPETRQTMSKCFAVG